MNDQVNENCQCVGTPIADPVTMMTLDPSNAPLSGTYKATQIIDISGNVSVEQNNRTTLIAPEVLLQPAFEVPNMAKFTVLQLGCD